MHAVVATCINKRHARWQRIGECQIRGVVTANVGNLNAEDRNITRSDGIARDRLLGQLQQRTTGDDRRLALKGRRNGVCRIRRWR